MGNRRRRDVSSKFYDKANVIEAPSFVTVDLGASYKVNDNFGVSVKVNNLFDEKYYRSVGTTAQGNYYGEPRSVLVQAKATF
ncbi:TonB-dependent receptor [Agrobacterium tumefaciens]|nr:TonB-dependent receptor [Agrobacterium tumefaciens]